MLVCCKVGLIYRQEKDGFQDFVRALIDLYEVIAPIEEDLVRFSPIKYPSQIFFKKNAYFPLKEYFFRKHEVLFTFDGKGFAQPKQKTPPRVFFGMRRCDLNAIAHQDQVFQGDVHDPYYVEARKNTFLLGYHCEEAPSKYCFCGSLNLKDFFDLMYYERGDHFLVEVGSSQGEKLITKYRRFFSLAKVEITKEEKKIKNAARLKKSDIAKLYENPDWQKGVEICLSCAACTNLCPTCYCFEIHDEVTTKNPSKGKRLRQWSSCQLPEFTRVAGDYVFREKREERFKHRVFHQLEYFKEKHGNSLCVGCGRCIEGCPTRIDFVDIINDMK